MGGVGRHRGIAGRGPYRRRAGAVGRGRGDARGAGHRRSAREPRRSREPARRGRPRPMPSSTRPSIMIFPASLKMARRSGLRSRRWARAWPARGARSSSRRASRCSPRDGSSPRTTCAIPTRRRSRAIPRARRPPLRRAGCGSRSFGCPLPCMARARSTASSRPSSGLTNSMGWRRISATERIGGRACTAAMRRGCIASPSNGPPSAPCITPSPTKACRSKRSPSVIARRLNLPLSACRAKRIEAHFGWFARFAQIDAPAIERQNARRARLATDRTRTARRSRQRRVLPVRTRAARGDDVGAT